jgi:RHS repeat-associated protein
MSSLTYGNGIAGTIGYDNQYRITGITVGTVMKLTYADDANGNITGITNNLDATKNKSFGYDALDRLTSGTGSWGSLSWTYDGVGNRLTENSNSYTYTAGTNKLSSANGLSYGFDNNGNTTSENARIYTYNQNQRLIQVVDGAMTAGYTYNGNGQRVKKIVNGVTTIFHYSLGGQIVAESSSSGTITAEYVYLNGNPLAKIEGTLVYYYHNDHLGTPQKMTDSTGAVVWAADYKPFGEATITVSTITNNLRYPGQYFDAETGLNYNYFRDYNPVIGRYIEKDPIGIRRGKNHLYTYVKNNSNRFIDIFGLHTAIRGGRPVYHQHGNNPPHWGGEEGCGKGAVSIVLPETGSDMALNESFGDLVYLYAKGLSLAAYVFVTSEAGAGWGLTVYESLEFIIDIASGDPASIPQLPAPPLVNPPDAW